MSRHLIFEFQEYSAHDVSLSMIRNLAWRDAIKMYNRPVVILDGYGGKTP